ncbi:MAG: hypothetical protein KBE65_14240 [Phycisphaerae bacterium]|nr:hypothetical protein [Phycisphaerae bacterium]
MTSESSVEYALTIMGQEIPVQTAFLRNEELRFYPYNPRIYSLLSADDKEPSQDEIEKCLVQMDHVRQLKQSIMANGGLLDPLLVRSGDNVVLEGNSRLAAYRLLSRGNAVKWAKVKCTLLPADLTDDRVFAMLGEYHIIGRKDWAPFEQAGYLWRRNTKHGITAEQMEKEVGLSAKAIKHMITVYSFMVDHNEVDPQRWSYYDEYLKSRKIGDARKYLPELDDVVVTQVREGRIGKAADVRDRLSRICASERGKAIKRFISGERSFEECYEDAVAGGANNAFYQRLQRFRTLIKAPDVRKEIAKMPTDLRKKCRYELDKIYKRAKELHDMLSGE